MTDFLSGHLMEQVINASSGNKGDVITLIRHIVEVQKHYFNVKIIGLIGFFSAWAILYSFQ